MAGYKSKTIKAILSRRLKQWTDTITDDALREQVRKNVIITGGSIVSMLLGEEVNDFDVYFRDYDTTLAVAEYYVSKFKEQHGEKDFRLEVNGDYRFESEGRFETAQNNENRPKRVKIIAKSAGVVSEQSENGEYKYFEMGPDQAGSDYISKVMDNPAEIEDTHEDTKLELQKDTNEGRYRPVFLSSNAITLSDKIQIVLRFYGEAEDIHKNYDFVHCTSYWTSWDNQLTLRAEALESILSKELRYVGSKYPICSIVRLRKFINRGWRVNAGQILKMCYQISELDLTNLEVLEEQLTGVDTAYFAQLIQRLKEADGEKLNAAYIVEIVDRMF